MLSAVSSCVPHRSWWVPLTGPDALREGANILSIVLQPAVTAAMRAKAAYPYPVPTMQVCVCVCAQHWLVPFLHSICYCSMHFPCSGFIMTCVSRPEQSGGLE